MNTQKLTKAQLEGLVQELASRLRDAEATPKAKASRAKAPARKFRIVNPDKACIVGTPLRDSAPTYAKGKTFALWLDGEAKRRAYDGGAWLVVDTRGLEQADITDIAKAWNTRATGKPVGDCVVFTKAGK